MTFQDPLALALLLPLALLLLIWRSRLPRAFLFPPATDLSRLPKTLRQRVAGSLPLLHMLTLALAVVALARPQLVDTETVITSKGVDIVLAIDLSTSMLAVDRGTSDLSRSRFAVARNVAREFIAGRTGDRIGFVVFAGRPYPAAPLTLDHDWLGSILDRLEVGSIEDGTALGDGLASALNRLRDSPALNRAVILITDGRANTGLIAPRDAAAAARALGIRVYAIGIGNEGEAVFPVADPLGGVVWREVSADLDEATLRDVAATSGGRYFRATGAADLRSVFREIGTLEKSTLEQKTRRNAKELFPSILLIVMVMVMTECALKTLWLRKLP